MKSKNVGRIIIFMLEIVVILIMTIVVVSNFGTGTKNKEKVDPADPGDEVVQENDGPHILDIDESKIIQNSGIDDPELTKITKKYWNIALFGVDAKTTNELFKGSRSDSMMIASINTETGEIKLLSVYRDTYLNTGNDKYRKCNAAYSAGGAEQAINMLNSNMDLNIKDFLTVNYKAVIQVVDGVGGVWIDIDSEELRHINNYQETISKDVLGNKPFTPVKETGYQLLNGLQATAYCRIRYTKGDDFKRAERQREVIKAIESQAKEMGVTELLSLLNDVANGGNIYTSIDLQDMIKMVKNIGNYRIVEEGGFPNENMRTTGTIGAKGSCVIPLDLYSNVKWLHEYLYGIEDYEPSKEVSSYSEVIKSDTRQYIR